MGSMLAAGNRRTYPIVARRELSVLYFASTGSARPLHTAKENLLRASGKPSRQPLKREEHRPKLPEGWNLREGGMLLSGQKTKKHLSSLRRRVRKRPAGSGGASANFPGPLRAGQKELK